MMIVKIKSVLLKHQITFWTIFSGLIMAIYANIFSLWVDEIFSINIIKLTFKDLTILTINDVHPPLYYYLLKLWMGIFGDSEFMLRLLSLIFYLIAVIVVLKIIKKIFNNPKLTNLIGIILTFSGYALRIGIDIRMYSLGFLLISLSFLVYLDLNTKNINRIILPILITLSMLTHYATFLFFVGLVIYDFISKHNQFINKTIKDRLLSSVKLYQSIILSILLFLPWIILLQSYRVALLGKSWVPVIHPFEIIYQPILFLSGAKLPLRFQYLTPSLILISIMILILILYRKKIFNVIFQFKYPAFSTFIILSLITYSINFITLNRFAAFYARYLALITFFWFLLSLGEIFHYLIKIKILRYVFIGLLLVSVFKSAIFQNGERSRDFAKCLNNKDSNAVFLFVNSKYYTIVEYYLGPNKSYLLTKDENILKIHNVWIETKIKQNNFNFITLDKLTTIDKIDGHKIVIVDNSPEFLSCHSKYQKYIFTRRIN